MKKISHTSLPRKKRLFGKSGKRLGDDNTIYNGNFEEVYEGNLYKKRIKMRSIGEIAKACIGTIALLGLISSIKNYDEVKPQYTPIRTPTAIVRELSPTPNINLERTLAITPNNSTQNNPSKTLESKIGPNPSKTPSCTCYTPENNKDKYTFQIITEEPKVTNTPKPTDTRYVPTNTPIKTNAPTLKPTAKPTSTPKPTATQVPTPVPTSTDTAEVILYDDANYSGRPLRATKIGKWVRLFDLGKVQDKTSGMIRDFDNTISSVQINGDYYVELYSEPGYKGEMITIDKNTSELPTNMNNKASSAKIFPKTYSTKIATTSTPIPTSISNENENGKGKLKINDLEYEVTFPEDGYEINFTRGNYTYSPVVLNQGNTKGTKYSSMKVDFGDRWEASYTAPNGNKENTVIKYDSNNGLSFPVITTPNGKKYIVFKVPKEMQNNKQVWLDHQTSSSGQTISEKIENKEFRDFMLCPADFNLSEYSSANKSYVITDPIPTDQYSFCVTVARESLK